MQFTWYELYNVFTVDQWQVIATVVYKLLNSRGLEQFIVACQGILIVNYVMNHVILSQEVMMTLLLATSSYCDVVAIATIDSTIE